MAVVDERAQARALSAGLTPGRAGDHWPAQSALPPPHVRQKVPRETGARAGVELTGVRQLPDDRVARAEDGDRADAIDPPAGRRADRIGEHLRGSDQHLLLQVRLGHAVVRRESLPELGLERTIQLPRLAERIGQALARARILPSIGSWILILLLPAAVVAVPVVLFVAPGLQRIGQTSLGITIGAGLLAWGYALWRDPAEADGHSADTQ